MDNYLTKAISKESRYRDLVKVDVTELGAIDPDTGKPKKTYTFVRALSAREKDFFEHSLFKMKKGKREINLIDSRARLAVLCCCDENGKRIFEDADVEWLTEKSAKALTRIADAARKLSEISDEDEEELVKNSEETPTLD